MRSKKANLGLDILIIAIMIFVIAVCVFVNHLLNQEINNSLGQAFNDSNQTMARDALQRQADQQPVFWDYALPTIMLFAWLAMIFGTLLLDANPVLLAIGIVLLLPTLMAGIYMANSFEDFTSDSQMATYTASYPLIMWIFSHWILLLVIIGLTETLAIYGKIKFL